MSRVYLAIGAAFGLIAVAAGAFGAHAIRDRLTPEMLAVYETAARYQLTHALAIVIVALAAARWPSGLWSVSAAFFTAGIVLFSGSLYGLSLSGVRSLGAITPVGGVCLLAGWALFILAALRDVS